MIDLQVNGFAGVDFNSDELEGEDFVRAAMALKNIGVHKASRSDEVQQEDYNRIDKICNLIKLHIHVRLLMMCELMTIHIDFNWRRMLDDSKDSSKNDDSILLKKEKNTYYSRWHRFIF